MGGAALAVLIATAAAPAVAGASTPPAASVVLSAKTASSLGYPKTFEAAKRASVSGVKGCASAVHVVYEDAAKKTALIVEVLSCSSPTTASNAFATVHKQLKPDSSIPVPKALGKTAFATSTDAPQYLLVWKAGNRVAFTALDTDVAASTATETTTPLPTFTKAQKATLGKAALKQGLITHP
jgi:hypothetical protein